MDCAGRVAARVLSVFGRLCNLINDRGEVVAIVSPAVGNGPFHIVLDEPVAFSSFLDMDALIAVHAEEISLADTVIDLRGSALWTAAPHWPELHALRGHITQRLRDLGEWIQSRAPTGSMIQSQSEDAIRESPPYPYHVDRVSHRLGMTGLGILAMRRPANELSAAVAAADPVTCQRAARQLAGSGSGLTPAGDDYLVGAIYAAWILLAPDEAAIDCPRCGAGRRTIDDISISSMAAGRRARRSRRGLACPLRRIGSRREPGSPGGY